VLEVILVLLIIILAFGLIGNVIGLLWTLLIGALVGWLASLIMHTDEQQGALLNVLVGIAGSLLGRWLFADILGIGGAATAGQFTILGILWGVTGAVVLIVILKAIDVLK
jgi:uncharacterized membrane protein YeaQ/YmgE (transglycosylase-associated protein family)